MISNSLVEIVPLQDDTNRPLGVIKDYFAEQLRQDLQMAQLSPLPSIYFNDDPFKD
jgi:hypothetical protein